MKVQCFLPVTILVSVALMGVMNIRKKEHDSEDRRNKFQDVKLRVTEDVLGEYQNDKLETHNMLEKTKISEKAMRDEANKLRTKAQEAKVELDICKGKQKSTRDELALSETELKNLQADYDKEKTSWKTESETLKQQLAARSAVCGVLKTKDIDVDVVRKLCGDDVIVEAAKQEEAKQDAAKQEEAKKEAPKQEEAKKEAPKQEEAKNEAAKQEEAKNVAAKQEEAKNEAAKQDEAKNVAAKQEEAKNEAAKQDEAKNEAAKQEEAKNEAAKQEEAKNEAAKQEAHEVLKKR